jgi:hypothetical protein
MTELTEAKKTTGYAVRSKKTTGYAGFFVSDKASDDRYEGVYPLVHDRINGGSGRSQKQKRQVKEVLIL